MASDLVVRLRNYLGDPEAVASSAFRIAQDLSSLVNEATQDPGMEAEAQDLILRALELRSQFGAATSVIEGLARARGLYPYLDADSLSINELLAYEWHRAPELDDVVLHRVQAEAYRLLIDGTNLILSAPTSFGKSLIIDAVIAAKRYSRVVIVVPTIALIDETRRRLVNRFRDSYKIITHIGQEPAERTIYVLTQERVIEMPSLTDVDFFVIDEFYKLDPSRDQERAVTLNHAFYRLLRTGAQFYLLGPNIRAIPLEIPSRLKCTFISTDYSTVASDITRIRVPAADRLEALVALCRDLHDPTLVYCASPASARRVAGALEIGAPVEKVNELTDAATWIGAHYHPDWVFVRALRRGIGLHHGKVPRALQQFVVRMFDNNLLRFLVCTSTLIEGVNTKAKNVVVYDNKIATSKFDYFTFNNIRGRSGRMFQHFIGRAFLFNDPPQEDLPGIDVPFVTQPDTAAGTLLVQLDEADLSPRSLRRVQDMLDQEEIGLDVLRANHGIDPAAQIALARELKDRIDFHGPLLAWQGFPTYDQLRHVCRLIWEFLMPDRRMRGGVASGDQLAFKVNRFRHRHIPKTLILEELAQQTEPDVDAAVEDTLEFVRYWATYHFPQYLMAVHRIQEAVLRAAGLTFGDYRVYATQVENQFASPGISALDEYGVPLEVARKLATHLGDPETLDESLRRLAQLDIARLGLDAFEREVVTDAKRNL